MGRKNIRILWSTGNALSRFSIAIKRLFRCILYDLVFGIRILVLIPFKSLNLIKRDYPVYEPPINKRLFLREMHSSPDIDPKPILFASACQDKYRTGGQKYNGGLKQLNLLIKLARMKGYEGYMVTYDGKYENWLHDHQPCISLKEFIDKSSKTENTRCITSWILAKSFIKKCDSIYFWDMELAYTENSHFRKLSRLYRKKRIKNTAGISRTIQAWHMAHFSKQSHVIPSMLDQNYWRSDKKNKVHNRVGYMYEDQGTGQRIQEIAASLKASNLDLEFYPVQGPEWKIKQKLHTCSVFLSMNQGKDPLWGEGCPITIIEAMNAGCVVIGYELIGNREIIIDNYNGFIVHNQSQLEVIEKLIHLFRNPEEMERIRSNSYAVLDEIHKLEDRWPVIKEFLDL